MNSLTAWLADNFAEIAPRDFYRGIFPSGELECKGEFVQGKYTGIMVAIRTIRDANGKRKVYRYNITDDLDAIEIAVSSNDFCLCSPLSYAGKKRTAENARMLYAIAIDLDKIRMKNEVPLGLENLWYKHIEEVKRIPKPTYIVSSGTGVHLYYVLDNPLPLFDNIAYELQEFKRELTRLVWHDTIVDIKNSAEIQQEGIYQGFRIPGTVTKNGTRAVAFITGTKVSMQYLNSFVSDTYKATKAESIKKQKQGKLTIEEAKEKYPEWYEKRVVHGEKRGVWAVNRNLYEWWKHKILDGAQVGHRYYCLMMLAIYAQKCSYYDAKHNPKPVTQTELEKDCFELLEYMERLTVSEDNHFGEDDILDALEAFQEKWTTYPREAIEYRTAISIPQNKRNGQTQEEHLEEARAIRDIRARRRGEKWDAHNGRKPKRDIVEAWRLQKPNGTKAECIKETGLAKMTVYKYWD